MLANDLCHRNDDTTAIYLTRDIATTGLHYLSKGYKSDTDDCLGFCTGACVWFSAQNISSERTVSSQNVQYSGFHLTCFSKIAPDDAYTPFTQGLRPLCLPCATTKLSRSPLKAEGRQSGCLGRSRVVHRTFRHRHGRHGRREVLSMFKTVAQRSPRRSVAHRSLKGGRMKAHTSPWSQNGCTVVDHWSPS